MPEIPNVPKFPVFFVAPNTLYDRRRFDLWDKKRDATRYPGKLPAVLHPPCRLWGRLRKFSTAPKEEKDLAIWALRYVRTFGGILEHPADSKLWSYATTDDLVLKVDLHHFGFPAKKSTRLLVAGAPLRLLPPIPLPRKPITRKIGTNYGLPELPKSKRSQSPPGFIDWVYTALCVIHEQQEKWKLENA